MVRLQDELAGVEEEALRIKGGDLDAGGVLAVGVEHGQPGEVIDVPDAAVGDVPHEKSVVAPGRQRHGRQEASAGAGLAEGDAAGQADGVARIGGEITGEGGVHIEQGRDVRLELAVGGKTAGDGRAGDRLALIGVQGQVHVQRRVGHVDQREDRRVRHAQVADGDMRGIEDAAVGFARHGLEAGDGTGVAEQFQPEDAALGFHLDGVARGDAGKVVGDVELQAAAAVEDGGLSGFHRSRGPIDGEIQTGGESQGVDQDERGGAAAAGADHREEQAALRIAGLRHAGAVEVGQGRVVDEPDAVGVRLGQEGAHPPPRLLGRRAEHAGKIAGVLGAGGDDVGGRRQQGAAGVRIELQVGQRVGRPEVDHGKRQFRAPGEMDQVDAPAGHHRDAFARGDAP